MNLIQNLFPKQLSDEEVIDSYIKSGVCFARDVRLLDLGGECATFREDFNEWKRLEREYVHRGYRAAPLEEFMILHEYGSLTHPRIMKKDVFDYMFDPVFHAETFEKEYYDT